MGSEQPEKIPVVELVSIACCYTRQPQPSEPLLILLRPGMLLFQRLRTSGKLQLPSQHQLLFLLQAQYQMSTLSQLLIPVLKTRRPNRRAQCLLNNKLKLLSKRLSPL